MARFLNRFARAALLGFVLLGAATGRARGDGGQITMVDVRATGFPQVTARFTIAGPGGEPLPTLKSEDFAVTENGRPIRSVIAYPLYESPTPLVVAMALDVSASMGEGGKLDAEKAAAKVFVSQLRPIDQVELISFGDKLTTVVPFTRDKAALARGIDGLAARGQTIFYDATDRAVSDVLKVPGTRVVIVLTDGQDMASRSQLAGALDLAKQTRVPIYTIGLGGNVGDDILAGMASDTAGQYFKAPKTGDLATAFRQLQRALASAFELYYLSPLDQRPGEKVNVVIRVPKAPGGPLQASFSYVMPPLIASRAGPVDPGQLQPVPQPTPVAVAPPRPLAFVPPQVPTLPPEWPALSAAVAVLAMLVGFQLSLTRDRVERRLQAYVGGAGRRARPLSEAANGRLFTTLLNQLANLARQLLPARQIEQLDRYLRLAGNPYGWGVQEYLGVRVLCGIALALVGYLYGASRGPVPLVGGVILAGALGYLLPAVWLGRRIRARQQVIFRAMPNALDLLAVTVEAGLGLDQALNEVCQKWQNELTREFSIFLAEVRIGRDRREALRAIAERTGVRELNSFVGAILQADELGTGIARTLQIQAEQIRIRRYQAAEKKAHEAAIKMIFPLVFLIFPAIFVVLLGPAIPAILGALSGVGR